MYLVDSHSTLIKKSWSFLIFPTKTIQNWLMSIWSLQAFLCWVPVKYATMQQLLEIDIENHYTRIPEEALNFDLNT